MAREPWTNLLTKAAIFARSRPLAARISSSAPFQFPFLHALATGSLLLSKLVAVPARAASLRTGPVSAVLEDSSTAMCRRALKAFSAMLLARNMAVLGPPKVLKAEVDFVPERLYFCSKIPPLDGG